MKMRRREYRSSLYSWKVKKMRKRIFLYSLVLVFLVFGVLAMQEINHRIAVTGQYLAAFSDGGGSFSHRAPVKTNLKTSWHSASLQSSQCSSSSDCSYYDCEICRAGKCVSKCRSGYSCDDGRCVRKTFSNSVLRTLKSFKLKRPSLIPARLKVVRKLPNGRRCRRDSDCQSGICGESETGLEHVCVSKRVSMTKSKRINSGSKAGSIKSTNNFKKVKASLGAKACNSSLDCSYFDCEVCLNHKCVSKCKDNYKCNDGRCVLKGEALIPQKKVNGERCSYDNECLSGFCGKSVDGNERVCTSKPVGKEKCSSNLDCLGDFECINGECVYAPQIASSGWVPTQKKWSHKHTGTLGGKEWGCEDTPSGVFRGGCIDWFGKTKRTYPNECVDDRKLKIYECRAYFGRYKCVNTGIEIAQPNQVCKEGTFVSNEAVSNSVSVSSDYSVSLNGITLERDVNGYCWDKHNGVFSVGGCVEGRLNFKTHKLENYKAFANYCDNNGIYNTYQCSNGHCVKLAYSPPAGFTCPAGSHKIVKEKEPDLSLYSKFRCKGHVSQGLNKKTGQWEDVEDCSKYYNVLEDVVSGGSGSCIPKTGRCYKGVKYAKEDDFSAFKCGQPGNFWQLWGGQLSGIVPKLKSWVPPEKWTMSYGYFKAANGKWHRVPYKLCYNGCNPKTGKCIEPNCNKGDKIWVGCSKDGLYETANYYVMDENCRLTLVQQQCIPFLQSCSEKEHGCKANFKATVYAEIKTGPKKEENHSLVNLGTLCRNSDGKFEVWNVGINSKGKLVWLSKARACEDGCTDNREIFDNLSKKEGLILKAQCNEVKTHLACIDNKCVSVEGSGDDECSPEGSVCGSSSGSSGGPGSECESNSDCANGCWDNHGIAWRYYAGFCDNGKCSYGGGAPCPSGEVCSSDHKECTSPSDSNPPPSEPTTHLACIDNKCVSVEGSGDDECSPEGSLCGKEEKPVCPSKCLIKTDKTTGNDYCIELNDKCETINRYDSGCIAFRTGGWGIKRYRCVDDKCVPDYSRCKENQICTMETLKPICKDEPKGPCENYKCPDFKCENNVLLSNPSCRNINNKAVCVYLQRTDCGNLKCDALAGKCAENPLPPPNPPVNPCDDFDTSSCSEYKCENNGLYKFSGCVVNQGKAECGYSLEQQCNDDETCDALAGKCAENPLPPPNPPVNPCDDFDTSSCSEYKCENNGLYKFSGCVVNQGKAECGYSLEQQCNDNETCDASEGKCRANPLPPPGSTTAFIRSIFTNIKSWFGLA